MRRTRSGARSGSMVWRRPSSSAACSATLCLLVMGTVLALWLSAAWAQDSDGSPGDGNDSDQPDQDPYQDPSVPAPAAVSAGRWVTPEIWDRAFPHRNDPSCPGATYYDHWAFVSAAESFPSIGTTGSEEQQRREVAALMAHMAHETGGGRLASEDGPHAWGLCIREETPCVQYCNDYQNFDCPSDHTYCGRGPLQMRWNYKYGLAGQELNFDGIYNPEFVESDPVTGFKTAMWLWNWPQPPKPVLRDIMTGRWQPSSDDYQFNRSSGFGLTINIMNGLEECGRGPNQGALDRLDFYRRFCSILEVDPGPNLDCEHQAPYT